MVAIKRPGNEGQAGTGAGKNRPDLICPKKFSKKIAVHIIMDRLRIHRYHKPYGHIDQEIIGVDRKPPTRHERPQCIKKYTSEKYSDDSELEKKDRISYGEHGRLITFKQFPLPKRIQSLLAYSQIICRAIFRGRERSSSMANTLCQVPSCKSFFITLSIVEVGR